GLGWCQPGRSTSPTRPGPAEAGSGRASEACSRSPGGSLMPVRSGENVKQAVIYVRASSREQAEGGYSIEAQLEACRRFARDQGWIIEDEFTELGESGRTDNRPAFKAMMAMLDEHGHITHLVHKIDRLARNLADYAAIKARMKKLGIRLVSVSEGFEE